MWTPTTRQQHSRTVTRYLTDLTDAEWHVIARTCQKPCATGRPREWPTREIVNGIFYVMRAGCPWWLLRTTFRHGERFTAGSPSGATTGALNG